MTAVGRQVAIMAGGAGTRLRAKISDIPKPMAPVCGVPVLEHLVGLCRRSGFTDILLLVHHQHEVIRDHFGDGSRFGISLSYSVEPEPRGTAGALRDALQELSDDFLVLYGDTYAEVCLRSLWEFHLLRQADVTLALHPNDHPHDSDIVEVDESQNVVAIHGYPRPADYKYPNLVNAALYAVRKSSIGRYLPSLGRQDLAKHTFPAMLKSGARIQGYLTSEYIKDMGTPERLEKVERDVRLGLPDALSLSAGRRAILYDRDGTLIEDVPHLRDPAQLRLYRRAADAIRMANRSGLLAVVVTNQPVVARGEVTLDGLRAIHAELDHQLGLAGAYVDRLYYCPHHPDRGFAGEVTGLKVVCNCRKPETGMIDTAARDLRINRSQSWMIGDSSADVLAGSRAGLKTILLRTGAAGRDRKWNANPDFVMRDVYDATAWVIRGYFEVARRCVAAAFSARDSRVVLVGGLARSGKSSIAQVMADQLRDFGRKVHVLPLDGWIKMPEQRVPREGVAARFQFWSVAQTILAIASSSQRQWLEVPVYDRGLRRAVVQRRFSIGPEDLLIVEGVPALLDVDLAAAAHVRVYVSVEEAERRERFFADYEWREVGHESVSALWAERDMDEHPVVRASEARATHVISGGGKE